FFFSGRRRHTRFSRDWSSDVCSSDLAVPAPGSPVGRGPARPAAPSRTEVPPAPASETVPTGQKAGPMAAWRGRADARRPLAPVRGSGGEGAGENALPPSPHLLGRPYQRPSGMRRGAQRVRARAVLHPEPALRPPARGAVRGGTPQGVAGGGACAARLPSCPGCRVGRGGRGAA